MISKQLRDDTTSFFRDKLDKVKSKEFENEFYKFILKQNCPDCFSENPNDFYTTTYNLYFQKMEQEISFSYDHYFVLSFLF